MGGLRFVGTALIARRYPTGGELDGFGRSHDESRVTPTPPTLLANGRVLGWAGTTTRPADYRLSASCIYGLPIEDVRRSPVRRALTGRHAPRSTPRSVLADGRDCSSTVASREPIGQTTTDGVDPGHRFARPWAFAGSRFETALAAPSQPTAGRKGLWLVGQTRRAERRRQRVLYLGGTDWREGRHRSADAGPQPRRCRMAKILARRWKGGPTELASAALIRTCIDSWCPARGTMTAVSRARPSQCDAVAGWARRTRRERRHQW